MKNPQNSKVYLTFPTDPFISDMLKVIAHSIGKTQPELINEICEGYVENALSILEEKGFMNTEDPN